MEGAGVRGVATRVRDWVSYRRSELGRCEFDRVDWKQSLSPRALKLGSDALP